VETVNVKFLSFVMSEFYFAERLYTDKHEWVLVDGKTGTVGISHYAQVGLEYRLFTAVKEPCLIFKNLIKMLHILCDTSSW
jgi:hypothetical protein